MQPGDVFETFADIDDLGRDIGFAPKVDIQQGLKAFVAWYLEHAKSPY